MTISGYNLWSLGLALVLPLTGCSAAAQDAMRDNAASAVFDEVSLYNIEVDLGSRLTVDTKLKTRGPDGWHHIALYSNWDFTETAVWQWIISQPDCDRATALEIFWKAQPDYYLRYRDRRAIPARDREGYDLVISIRDRWMSGGYQRAKLASDPLDIHLIDFVGLNRRYGRRVVELMPLSMRVRVRGGIIENASDPLPGMSN